MRLFTHRCPTCSYPFHSVGLCLGQPYANRPHEPVLVVPLPDGVMLERCIGCQAGPGVPHDEDACDHAHCPACGGQREMCRMFGVHEDVVLSIWPGEDPLSIAARKFDIYMPFDIEGNGVITMEIDSFRIRTELAWCRAEQRWVEHSSGDAFSDGPQCRWVRA